MNELFRDYNDMLSPQDLQKILKIGRSSVYSYLADGTIKSIKIANKYRVPKTFLLEFLDKADRNE